MTPQEAKEIANVVLVKFGEQPIVVTEACTDRKKIERVLHEYAKRLRAKRPAFNVIKDDRMLPDLVIQRITEGLISE
jgi:hypothetical protein